VQIDKTCRIDAPIDALWKALLDPSVIARCLPGVEAVEAIDPTRFTAVVGVKVGLIAARFSMQVTIVAQRPPEYLKSVAVGDAAGMAGSVRGTTELRLAPVAAGATRVDIHADVDVFGRLGTFGYGVLKGKVDRMWQEFAANLASTVAPS
jgi:carbon monoxide dehydrogenase subunit G